MIFKGYFMRSNLITKGRLASLTTPLLRKALLRLVDFFVRMCRLKDFWKVISPLPVTLKRFLALELVLTFGIFIYLLLHPRRRSEQTETYGAMWAICFKTSLSAKHKN